MAQITFNCTEEEKLAFLDLARRSQTSVTALGQHAMRQVLLAADAGAKPMVRPVDGKNAPQTMLNVSIGADNIVRTISPTISDR